MKALSVRQPWMWTITEIPEDSGPKRTENRGWDGCGYRGPVLLHASKGCTRAEYQQALESIAEMRQDMRERGEIGSEETIVIPTLSEQPRGVLLGIARIVGASRHPEYRRGYHGYRIAGALGLELADVRKLPPVPYSGMLGFFGVNLRGCQHEDAYKAAWAELEEAEKTRKRTVSQGQETAPPAGRMPPGWKS